MSKHRSSKMPAKNTGKEQSKTFLKNSYSSVFSKMNVTRSSGKYIAIPPNLEVDFWWYV